MCAVDVSRGGFEQVGLTQAEEDSGKGDEGMKGTCRPIRVEVWEIGEEVRGEVLTGWKRPERSGYRGMHGMGIPEGERRG
jgi:hypothetical protein